MIDNRDLTLDDYLAILRRRLKLILIPALLAPLVGFLISYAFTAKYTSQSLVLVEGQKVPEGVVQPVVTQDLAQRIATMQQQVLGRNRLQPMVERMQLVRGGKNLDDVIEEIRASVQIEPVVTDIGQIGNQGGKRKPGTSRSGLLCELHSAQCEGGTEHLRRTDVDVALGEPEFARAGGAEHHRFHQPATGRGQA